MEEDARAVEEEPDDSHVNDERDVDGLAEARFRAFIVERIEQMDQLMLFEFAIAAGAHLDGLGGRRGVGRSLEGGHGLSRSDGYWRRKFRYKLDCELLVRCSGLHSPYYFLIFEGFYVEEANMAKFLKPMGEPRRLGG